MADRAPVYWVHVRCAPTTERSASTCAAAEGARWRRGGGGAAAAARRRRRAPLGRRGNRCRPSDRARRRVSGEAPVATRLRSRPAPPELGDRVAQQRRVRRVAFSFTSRLERRMRSAATPSGLRFAGGCPPLRRCWCRWPPPATPATGGVGRRRRKASWRSLPGRRKGRAAAPPSTTESSRRPPARRADVRGRARRRSARVGGHACVHASGGVGGGGGRRWRRRRRRGTCQLRSTGSAPAPLLTATTFAGNQVSSNSSPSPSTRSVPEYCARTGIPGCSSESSGWR